LVKARGGHVIVECQPGLLNLFASALGIDRLVPRGAFPPHFDVHAPLLSLPGILHTSLANVPAAVPYLHGQGELVRGWRQEARKWDGGLRPRLRIGIAWQGKLKYRYDRQRSISLTHFARLAKVPGIQLFSLQKGPGIEQLQGQKLTVEGGQWKLDETSGPFMDTAAIMENLDLIISSDTVIPHLAGALAVPVWVALSLVPDWRWLLEREDCPWYPTMRVFRQTRYGHWDDVFDRIAAELERIVARPFNQ
jgi:hypothetical protein